MIATGSSIPQDRVRIAGVGIGRDLMQLEQIRKLALLKQVFALAAPIPPKYCPWKRSPTISTS